MTDDHWRLEEFRRLLDTRERSVVFTGAGISTESGIPDFRSPGGVWTKYSPILYNDYISSEESRRESWRRKFDDSYGFDGAEPNRGTELSKNSCAMARFPRSLRKTPMVYISPLAYRKKR